jgi:hypothetical protein
MNLNHQDAGGGGFQRWKWLKIRQRRSPKMLFRKIIMRICWSLLPTPYATGNEKRESGE